MKHKRKLLATALLSCFVCSPPATRVRGASSASTLSLEEAKDLVRKVFESRGSTKRPKFGLDTYKDEAFPDLYFFEATWDNPNPGSAVLGHFAVDPITADVWDVSACKPVELSALRKIQDHWRKQVGLTQAKYLKLHRKAPCSL